MGFSLKGLLKGVGADLNFWDNGKSHGNMQGKPRPAPASTARPQINRSQPGQVNQGSLEVAPVKQPLFMTNSIAPVQAPPPLQVGVAQPKNLQIGNAVIKPNQNARTAAPVNQHPGIPLDVQEKINRSTGLTPEQKQQLLTPIDKFNPWKALPGEAIKSVNKVIVEPGINTVKLPYEATRVVAANVTHNNKARDNAVTALNDKSLNSYIAPLAQTAVLAGSTWAANDILNDPNTSDELKQQQLQNVNEGLAPIGFNLNDTQKQTNLKGASLFAQDIATPILTKGAGSAFSAAKNSVIKDGVKSGITSQLAKPTLQPSEVINNVTTKLVNTANLVKPRPLNEGGYIQLPGGKQVNDPLYHGSPNADQIRKAGFKDTKPSNGQIYGNGVYLAKDKRNSQIYANFNNDNILKVDLPKNAKIYQPTNIQKELFGKDTNYGDPKLITEKYKKLGYDGLQIGKNDNSAAEIVVFNPKHINVKSTTPENTIEKIKSFKSNVKQAIKIDDMSSIDSLLTHPLIKDKTINIQGVNHSIQDLLDMGANPRDVLKNFTNTLTTRVKTIHKDDQATMNDFVQYTQGKYRPDPKTAHELELDASRIAEHYGLPMPNNVKELGKTFQNELDIRGFNKPRPIVGAAQQSRLSKVKDRLKLKDDAGTLGKADETSPTIKNVLGEEVPNPHYKQQNSTTGAKEAPIVGQNLSHSSTPIIPSKSVQTPEQVVKQAKATLEGKPIKPAKAKLLDSASKSDKIPEDIVSAIDPTRSIKTNTESWNNAGQILFEHGDDGALKYFQENHGAEANAVAWRLFQKRLSNGDKQGAQSLLADMTTRSIEDGQSAQAWAMIKKLDPTYIVQKLDREVTRFTNKASDKLKGRIDWNADKQARIMQFSKGLGDDKLISKLTKTTDTNKITKLTGITDKGTLKHLAKSTDPERVKLYLTNNLNKEINSIIPSNIGDKAIAYWKSGLLSAPVTHVRNLVGNTMNAAANVIETPISGVLDATVGRALTPTKRTISANPLTGIKRGIKQGGQDFADAIQTGITADDVSKYNYKTINWNLKNPAEKYVFKPFTDAVFRTLGAEDKIFKAPGVLTSLYNQADAAAISAGKRGDVKWMAKWIENAPPIVKETAKKEGGAWVFQKDTVVSTGMRGLRNAIKRSHPGYEKIVEGIQPFVNVPAAIGSELMTYTPAGLLRVTNKSRKAIDKTIELSVRDAYRREAMKDLSKTSVGVGILTAGFAMGLSGDASGNMPPKNSREYDQWVLENRQPNSIKVGGKWFNINSVGPQLTLFNAAAQTGAQMRRDKNKGKKSSLTDNAIAFGGNVGTNFINSSSLTGATDATNVLKDPVTYGKNYVARQGTSFIPNVAKRAGSGLDPWQHDPQTTKEAIQAQIPGLRNKVAPKTDVTGAPVKNNQYGPFAAKALFDPFNVSQSKSSPLAKSLEDQINTDAKNKLAKDEAKKKLEGNKDTVKATNGKIVAKIDGEYKTFDNQGDADKAVAKSKFAKSDKSYQVIGDNVYRKSADGTVSVTSKTKYDYQVGTATLTAKKNAGDVKGWLETANSQMASIEKQLKDKNIDPLDAISLQNDAEALQKQINKYSDYGGFTKPKVGKKGKGKSGGSYDYAKGVASLNKTASGSQTAVRNLVKKNRIVRKARRA